MRITPIETEHFTKSTDRFILRWIKLNLSVHVTRRIVHIAWLKPWMITVCSTIIGVTGGLFFAAGAGFTGGLFAAVSQILDGVDGQFARVTDQASRGGAFLDSVLDRYTDGALVMGLTVLVVHGTPHQWAWGIVGALALMGSGLISYSSARADALGLDLGRPTLASKGTRTSVTIVCGLLCPFTPWAPFVGLMYLAVHTNLAVIRRIRLTHARQ